MWFDQIARILHISSNQTNCDEIITESKKVK